MNFIHKLHQSFHKNSRLKAFCIANQFFAYEDLNIQINNIRVIIQNKTDSTEKLIGLVTNNDIETYASIFALWMEGKAYIPINPDAPLERNNDILKQIKSKYVLDSSNRYLETNSFKVLNTKELNESKLENFEIKNFEPTEIAYILFTSGSTGKPKGIPISFENLNTLIFSVINDSNFVLKSSDRCLQMYDLTFDASITALLPGLFAGACIYTIPTQSIKYLEVFKLLTKHKLTVIKMVPSIIHYLRPYFNEIDAPFVRYCIFGGGKLFVDIIEEWQKSIPNSKIFNHYGPTEFTVCASYYDCTQPENRKTRNGVLSIGKPWSGVDYRIIDENGLDVDNGVEGELCLSGKQLTSGYINNKTLNSKQFFLTKNKEGLSSRFYKTGDVCIKDSEGDLLYIERKDFQVKIRGNRIELGEIEYNAKKILPNTDLIAIDITNELGNTELALVIIGKNTDIHGINRELKTVLPPYMVPTKYQFLNEFPMSSNGKIDRKKLRALIN